MGNTNKGRIVIIDDNPDSLAFVECLLQRAGYDVVGFTRAGDAVRHIEREPAQVVITDLLMPEMDGLEVLQCLKQKTPMASVIGISGGNFYDTGFLLRAMTVLGARAVFAKPIDPAALLESVAEAVTQPRML